MNDHNAYRWVSVDQLTEFDFAPADIPFVDMLRRGQIDLPTQLE
jgi:8-oxo-dGTP diphosphatase